MTDKDYIQILERRIHNQRLQLRWWQKHYELRALRIKPPPYWDATRVFALLRRLGSPHKILSDGSVGRLVKQPMRKLDD